MNGCNEAIEGKQANPSKKEKLESLEDLNLFLREKLMEFKRFIEKEVNKVQAQIIVNNELCSKISEKLTKLKNEVGLDENETKNECLALFTETSSMQHLTKLEKNVGSLEKAIDLNNDICSELSEEEANLKSESENESKNKKSTGNQETDSPPQPNLFFREILNSISFPDVGGSDPKLHKLFWIFIHTAALLIGTLYVLDAYDGWQNSPIVQGLTTMNVKDIPYPAITICEPLLLKEEYNRFEILKRCISLENETWLCSEEDLKMLRISWDIYPMEYDFLLLNETDTYRMKKLVYSNFSYTSHFLAANRIFRGTEYLRVINKLKREHISIFQVIGGPDGHNSIHLSSSTSFMSTGEKFGMYVCQTINGFSSRAKSGKEDTTWKKINLDKCSPEKIVGNEKCKDYLLYTDRKITLKTEDVYNIDLLKLPNINISKEKQSLHAGREAFLRLFRVFIHNAFDHPSMTSMIHEKCSRHADSSIAMRPSLINARNDLSLIDVSKRNCSFSFERKLSLFQIYTYKNCILECQINCSLRVCGCVPYTIAIFNSSLSICNGRRSFDCKLNSKFLISFEFKDDICHCDCPFDCASLTYEFQISKEKVESFAQETRIEVFYFQQIFTSTVTFSVTSPAEFVAYSLGILGVFNGFSMMFVWEILYWLILGLWSTIRRTLQVNP